MSTRIVTVAAAIAFVLPLAATRAFAQAEGTRDTGSYLGSNYRMEHTTAEGEMSTKTATNSNSVATRRSDEPRVSVRSAPRRLAMAASMLQKRALLNPR